MKVEREIAIFLNYIAISVWAFVAGLIKVWNKKKIQCSVRVERQQQELYVESRTTENFKTLIISFSFIQRELYCSVIVSTKNIKKNVILAIPSDLAIFAFELKFHFQTTKHKKNVATTTAAAAALWFRAQFKSVFIFLLVSWLNNTNYCVYGKERNERNIEDL